MEAVEQYLQVLRARKSELGFWMRRSSGYPLLIVTNLESEDSAAFAAGIRNDDIIFRINQRSSWEMAIGDALMLIVAEEDEQDTEDIVTIEWIAATHATLAFRAAHNIRTSNLSSPSSQTPTRTQPSQSESVSSTSVNWAHESQRQSIERRRELALQQSQSPEQIARHRARNRYGNMDEQQVVVHRDRTNRRIDRHDISCTAIQLNYADPCQHCEFRFLAGENKRTICCGGGKATQPPFPALTPLSPNIRRLATNYSRHFAEQSFQYNNILAFAIIGIDNGDPNTPGFVRPAGGPHCIKIHGRTYHRVATADRQRNAVRYVS